MNKLPKTVNCVGTVENVQAKFAYVSTAKGPVFCPLAASVPPDEMVPDMRRRYAAGDVVHVQAVPQDAKNGCNLRAKRIRHAKSSQQNDPLVVGDSPTPCITCVALIGHIQDGFLIADSFEYGSIFVPRSITGIGGIFDVLDLGDTIELRIRSQPERNNCKFVAIAYLNNWKNNDATYGDTTIQGTGVLSAVEPLFASLESANGRIFCPILTWTGGDLGDGANSLDEILRPGDVVSYKAAVREGVWRAVDWCLPDDQKKAPVKVMDSYTQTVPPLQDFACKMFSPAMRQSADQKPSVPLLLSVIEDEGL